MCLVEADAIPVKTTQALAIYAPKGISALNVQRFRSHVGQQPCSVLKGVLLAKRSRTAISVSLRTATLPIRQAKRSVLQAASALEVLKVYARAVQCSLYLDNPPAFRALFVALANTLTSLAQYSSIEHAQHALQVAFPIELMLLSAQCALWVIFAARDPARPRPVRAGRTRTPPSRPAASYAALAPSAKKRAPHSAKPAQRAATLLWRAARPARPVRRAFRARPYQRHVPLLRMAHVRPALPGGTRMRPTPRNATLVP